MDPDRPSADAPPPPGDPPALTGRRDFVRALGRDGVRSAGQIASVMGAVSGLSVAVGADLLGLNARDSGGDRAATPVARPSAAAGPPAAVATGATGTSGPSGDLRPWRMDGGTLLVLDQRELPGARLQLPLNSAAAVAASLDTLATPFGVALGEIASLGMVLAARGAQGATPEERTRSLSWNLRLLRGARPSSAAVEVALARQQAVLAAMPPDAAGTAVVAALEAEAAAFAAGSAALSAAIGSIAADLLARDGPEPVQVVTLGSGGAGSGAGMGIVGAVMGELLRRGGGLHAWIAETRPTLVGARIAAHELADLGVPTTVLADSAVGSLLGQVPIDAVVVTAERILPDGDVLAVVGTYPLAVLAARHGIPMLVVGPSWLATTAGVAPAVRSGPSRPASELGSIGGLRLLPGLSGAFVPLLDRTPADLITRVISEPPVAG